MHILELVLACSCLLHEIRALSLALLMLFVYSCFEERSVEMAMTFAPYSCQREFDLRQNTTMSAYTSVERRSFWHVRNSASEGAMLLLRRCRTGIGFVLYQQQW